MQDHLTKLEDEVSTWPHVSVHAHRFGGREFLFDKAEVVHVHAGGPLTFLFLAQSTMHFWQTDLLRSTAGFPIQAGSRFRCAVKTSAMPSGSCGCRTSGTR